VICRDGRLLAGGEYAPFQWQTYNRLVELELMAKSAGRIALTYMGYTYANAYLPSYDILDASTRAIGVQRKLKRRRRRPASG